MKTGALVLGIIVGLVALLYDLFSYGPGSLANAGQSRAGTGLKPLSLRLPFTGLNKYLRRRIIVLTLLSRAFAFYSWCLYTIRRTDRVPSWISLNVRISDQLLSYWAQVRAGGYHGFI